MPHSKSSAPTPNWLPRSLLAPLPDAQTLDWLFDEGSLTRRLTALSNDGFSVTPLQEGWQRLRADECALLGVADGSQGWVREVYLRGHGQPWVFARSVAARSALEGSGLALDQLGSRSLGELLFSDRAFDRGELQACRYPAQWLPVQACNQRLWARRSCFSRGALGVLVASASVGMGPLPTAAPGEALACGACLAEPPPFEGAPAALAYGPVARTVALRLKYGRRTGHARLMAQLMARRLAERFRAVHPVTVAREAPLWVMADPQKAQQAVLNVLSNAYKYSPQGGDVRIEFLQDDASPAHLARAVLAWLDAPERIAALQHRFTELHHTLQRDTAQLATDAIEQVLSG